MVQANSFEDDIATDLPERSFAKYSRRILNGILVNEVVAVGKSQIFISPITMKIVIGEIL